jgi:hypothetical protein
LALPSSPATGDTTLPDAMWSTQRMNRSKTKFGEKIKNNQISKFQKCNIGATKI